MRTDVAPPASGGMAGPPIGEEGSMLMRDGHLYFITRSGCTHEAAFGAIRPDWVKAVDARRSDASPLPMDDVRWVVDLARFDAGLVGCFNYVVDHAGVPKRFGGSSSCDWPKGSYIEYANFQSKSVASTVFDIPANCPRDPGDPAQSKGCHGCHDAP
jgi:hypothetical protein